MNGTCLIEVGYKSDVADPVGRGLLRDIRHLKLAPATDVRASQLYRLVGDINAEGRVRIARDLLCDPIVQDYREGDWRKDAEPMRGRKTKAPAVVDVWFKQGVTDAVGESVLKGIQDLPVAGVREVRTGIRYRFDGVTQAEAEKVTRAILANPLVNEYVIHAD